jgi:hypothetical protein
MSKITTGLEGEVLVPPEQIAELVRRATLLPPAYFVTVGKSKILADGALQCKFTASTDGPPPEPSA